jgi:hypothetical protein
MRTHEVVPFLREHGFPIGKSTFNKLTAPSEDRRPPFQWWGSIKLFGDADTLRWARENLGRKKLRAINREEEKAAPVLFYFLHAGEGGRESRKRVRIENH